MGLPGGREGHLAYDGMKQRDSRAIASSIGATPERFEMPSGAASPIQQCVITSIPPGVCAPISRRVPARRHRSFAIHRVSPRLTPSWFQRRFAGTVLALYGDTMLRIAVNAEAHESPVGNRPRGVLDLGGDDQSCLNGSLRACEQSRRLPAVGRSPSALALIVVLSAQLMVVLDFSIVNVALPSIQRELAFSATGLEWVVTAYAITFGGLLILGGRVGDLFGRRRLFLAGLFAFAAASLLGGFASSAGTLVAARTAQGVGAAVIAPTALALLTTTFAEGPARNRALGLYGATGSVGFVAGLVLGGALVTGVDRDDANHAHTRLRARRSNSARQLAVPDGELRGPMTSATG